MGKTHKQKLFSVGSFRKIDGDYTDSNTYDDFNEALKYYQSLKNEISNSKYNRHDTVRMDSFIAIADEDGKILEILDDGSKAIYQWSKK